VFILAPFIPARYIFRSVALERLAGPIVQTILVFFKNPSPTLSFKDLLTFALTLVLSVTACGKSYLFCLNFAKVIYIVGARMKNDLE
jgi:hypothetical protein